MDREAAAVGGRLETPDPLASRRSQGLIAVNVAAALFGTVALFGRVEASPLWIVATRAAFASLVLAGAYLVTRRRGLPSLAVRPPRRRLLLSIVWTGALLAIHWLTFFASVQWAGVAVATLTFAVFPLFTLLVESVRLARRPHPVEVCACLAIVAAVWLLVDPGQVDGDLWMGALAGLTSALAFSIFGISSKGLGNHLSPVLASLVQNLVVTAFLLPWLPFSEGAPGSHVDWLWLVVLGVVSTALMHQLFFFSLRRLEARTCSAFIALEPVYAIVYAAVFFGETITAWVIASAALIVGSSLVMLRLEGRPGGRA